LAMSGDWFTAFRIKSELLTKSHIAVRIRRRLKAHSGRLSLLVLACVVALLTAAAPQIPTNPDITLPSKAMAEMIVKYIDPKKWAVKDQFELSVKPESERPR